MEIYKVHRPKNNIVPILVSVPHSGTYFPDELRSQFSPKAIKRPDDTDWFVDDLYNFTRDLGITMIRANVHRWVIDLNRSPDNRDLYSDDRLITGLTPVTDFFANKIYKDKINHPNKDEVDRRILVYFKPYHDEIRSILTGFVEKFGIAVLWDAHSIRQNVPTIYPHPFPPLILGTNEGRSCFPEIAGIVMDSLVANGLDVHKDFIFKGGFITRNHGNPEKSIHALQLEMTKVQYMADNELDYDCDKAENMQKHLIRTFEKLKEKILKQ